MEVIFKILLIISGTTTLTIERATYANDQGIGAMNVIEQGCAKSVGEEATRKMFAEDP